MGWLSELLEGFIPDDIENVFKDRYDPIATPDITFKPFTVTGAQGGTVNALADGSTNFNLSPEQQAMQQQLFGGAQDFFTNASQSTAGREADIYERMRAVQRPEELRQRQAMQEQMFAQGRGGVRTEQYGGTPEQLAMYKAQAEAQNSTMLGAMQQAQQEQLQQSDIGHKYLQSSYAPQAGLLNQLAPAMDVASMYDVANRQQGEYELKARMADLNAMMGQDQGLAQLLGSTYGGLLGGLGGLLGTSSKNAPWWTSIFSDVRLKENIEPAGVTQDGIKLYTWEWKEGHEDLTNSQPTFGVLAQELIKVMPQAVHMSPEGYYKVDYSKVFEGEQE